MQLLEAQDGKDGFSVVRIRHWPFFCSRWCESSETPSRAAACRCVFTHTLINNKYNKDVNMAFRNLMLNVKMQIDHFEIVGELQIGGTIIVINPLQPKAALDVTMFTRKLL